MESFNSYYEGREFLWNGIGYNSREIAYECYMQGRRDAVRELQSDLCTVGWNDPRLADSQSRQVVFWVASMLLQWTPPHRQVYPDTPESLYQPGFMGSER